MKRIYLDHAATTPLSPKVREAMEPWLDAGNPSSLHSEGRKAREAVDTAREVVSERLGCSFGEVIFTSCGTEAANLAIIGTALANLEGARKRILFSAAEHHCVLHTQPILEKLGYQVELVPVDRVARIDLDALTESLGEDVLLVSAMHANNELGTWQPAREVAEQAHRHGALYHCDAVQTFGWYDWKVADLDADFVTASAHKLCGPKGVGALYTRAGVKPQPLMVGGGQEREVRAGTENVAGIVGFGAASGQVSSVAEKRAARDAFLAGLAKTNLAWKLTAPVEEVLDGHAHIRIPGVTAETMLILLDRLGVSASSGAACSSGSLEASHVLLACDYDEQSAKEGLRFTFGASNTVDEARRAAVIVAEAALQIRDAKSSSA